MDMFYEIWQYLPFRQFADPDKRIYWPYLLLCAVYVLLFIIFSKAKVGKLGIRYWFHPSAINDYGIWILNHLLQVLLLPLIFANGLTLSVKVYRGLKMAFGPADFNHAWFEWGIVWYALIFVVLSDFSRFILHYLMHMNKFLWSIHRLHHSAQVLTPITLFRAHPFEMVLFHVRYLLVFSLVTGSFLYIYNDFFEFPKLFGASFFVTLSAFLGANLRHSNIPIGFGFLERIFISPKQHQMHHSTDPELHHSNMGSLLSVWDGLFSTWKSSKNIGELEFGVKEQPRQNVAEELWLPLREAGLLLSGVGRKQKQLGKSMNEES